MRVRQNINLDLVSEPFPSLFSSRRHISSAMTSSGLADTTSGAIVSSSAGLVSAPTVTVPAAATFSGLITVRLSRTNFRLWKTQVVPVLTGANVFGYLDGSIPAPSRMITEGAGDAARQVSNPAFQRWFLQDQQVLGALLSNMTEEVLGQMTTPTSAHELWTSLHAMFSATNRACINNIRVQLAGEKKRDMTVAEYFAKMKGYADTMASVGHPLEDDEIISYIIAGLGEDYDALMASLTVINTPVTLTDFYSFLLSYEARQNMRANSRDDFSSSANNVARTGSNNTNNQRNTNNNGGGYRGNRGGGGYANRGGGYANRGGGRGRGNGGNRFRTRCQVCDKPGHEALQCRERFNHAFQASDPVPGHGGYHGDGNHAGYHAGYHAGHGGYHHGHGGYGHGGYQQGGGSHYGGYYGGHGASSSGGDPHWYMDTGATDHLTSELDRMTMHERYHGRDHVQVAN